MVFRLEIGGGRGRHRPCSADDRTGLRRAFRAKLLHPEPCGYHPIQSQDLGRKTVSGLARCCDKAHRSEA